MEEKKYITLPESTNILKLYIKTKDGKETGEYLEFNLKDIELLDIYQKCIDETQKNRSWITNQFAIIDKKQDFTKKGEILSNNEKEKYYAIKKYYQMQKETYDLFLGKGGTDKLLYGRKLEWETLIEIETIIKEQIAPHFDITMDNIANEIKSKYKMDITSQPEVLE